MKSIKKNIEFKKVYTQGKSIATSNLVLYWNQNHETENRYGFSVSKKIGNAVVRNKLKRRLKEIIRLNETNFKKGYNLIFIARKHVINLNYKGIKKDVIKLCKRADIWDKNN